MRARRKRARSEACIRRRNGARQPPSRTTGRQLRVRWIQPVELSKERGTPAALVRVPGDILELVLDQGVDDVHSDHQADNDLQMADAREVPDNPKEREIGFFFGAGVSMLHAGSGMGYGNPKRSVCDNHYRCARQQQVTGADQPDDPVGKLAAGRGPQHHGHSQQWVEPLGLTGIEDVAGYQPTL